MKLTKEIKENIIRDVIEEAFRPIIEEFYDEYEFLADKVYNHVYGPYADLMAQMPKGALPMSSSIYVYVEKKQYCLCFKVNRSRIDWISGASQVRRCFEVVPDSRYFEGDSELGRLIVRMIQAQSNIVTDMNDLKRELNSVILPCTTDTKLLKAWPEGEKWIIKYCKKPIQNLPVASTDKLNKKLCDLLGKTSPTCEGKS